jgi:hypothetical protein
MRDVTPYRKFRLAYLLVAAFFCYFLSGLPFSYSYFNSNFIAYGSNKKLCQLVENRRLPLLRSIQSLAIDFHDYMNKQNENLKPRLLEECPDR